MIDFYQGLLIKQYYDQPNALGEVELKAGELYAVKTFLDAIAQSFDLDYALDDRLDKIGKLVGIDRVIPLSAIKSLFGFDINPAAKSFDSKFEPRISAPFALKTQSFYTDTQLDNYTYRIFIKARIALNIMRGVMVGDRDTISLQDVVMTLFNGDGYVVDNLDMSLSLYIPYGFDDAKLRLIYAADLLPRTQGVRFYEFYRADVGSFGFDINANVSSFASKFNSGYNGGKFARKIIL